MSGSFADGTAAGGSVPLEAVVGAGERRCFPFLSTLPIVVTLLIFQKKMSERGEGKFEISQPARWKKPVGDLTPRE